MPPLAPPTPAHDSDPNPAGFGQKRICETARDSAQEATLAALAAEFGFDPAATPEGALKALAALTQRLSHAQHIADLDPLTGILNRRAFLREVARTTSYLQRYGGISAVVFIDIDDFKVINDRFGHATGDALLRGVANFIRANVRDSDAVGRLGGDEFAVLLAHSGITEAALKASLLAERLLDAPITHDGRTHRISASVGWHVIDSREDAEASVARADEAMYAQKALAKIRAGRRYIPAGPECDGGL